MVGISIKYMIRALSGALILVPIIIARQDIVSDPLQFIKQKTQQIIDVKGDPLQFIKREIMSASPVIADNPHKNDIARVRQGIMPAGPEELAWRAKRFPMIKAAQEKFLGMKLSDDEVLEVAISCSGGGFRAMLGSLGSLRIAQESGLLDCIMCISGLSGSTWCIGPWIASGVSLAEYKQLLFPRLKNGLVPSQSFATNAINNLLVKFASDQPLTSVDLYGSLLADTLLGGRDANYTYLASSFSGYLPSNAERITNVYKYPFPVYAAVLGDEKQEWVDFTPYEVGCRAYQAYVPTWAFGRKFNKGVSTDYAPEQTLGFLMGIFGSAYCFNFRTAYETVMPRLLAIPLLKDILEPIRLELLEPVMHTQVGDIRFAYAAVNNFMTGMPGHPLAHVERLKLVDAGVVMSNPIFSTYRIFPEGKAPDIIIAFDYGQSALGDRELFLASAYAVARGLPFPVLPHDIVERSKWEKQVFSVFGNAQNLALPVVCYMPRIKDEQLLEKNKQDSRYTYYVNLLSPLNWESIVRKGYANTLNMAYSPEQAETVCALSEFNMLTHIDAIRDLMSKRVLAKRKGVQ
ncbi:hypothetical protein KJZ61_00610 [Candidatus Dependentiae bacterium]|nr:hypothetical protein [Candidatus Dependentiae bacterium]